MAEVSRVIRQSPAFSSKHIKYFFCSVSLASATLGISSAYRSMSKANFSTKSELDGDCDCYPMWECMQSEGRDCTTLELQLKECLAQKKAKS